MYRVGMPPLGWEWEGEEGGPPAPTPQQRAKTIPEKNWAPRLQELGRELFHGTSQEAAYEIQRSGVLEPRSEWGKGHAGIFAWSDLESALNWANYWFGDPLDNWDNIAGGGSVVIIPSSALKVVRRDLDPGNDNWKAWVKPQGELFSLLKKKDQKLRWAYSQAFVIENPIPASELSFIDEILFNEYREEWEEQVDEWWGLKPPYPNYVEFIGEEGPEWASYYG